MHISIQLGRSGGSSTSVWPVLGSDRIRRRWGLPCPGVGGKNRVGRSERREEPGRDGTGVGMVVWKSADRGRGGRRRRMAGGSTVGVGATGGDLPRRRRSDDWESPVGIGQGGGSGSPATPRRSPPPTSLPSPSGEFFQASLTVKKVVGRRRR